MLSPDLIPGHAEELFESWKQKLLTEKRRGENTRALAPGSDQRLAPDTRTKGAAAILDLA